MSGDMQGHAKAQFALWRQEALRLVGMPVTAGSACSLAWWQHQWERAKTPRQAAALCLRRMRAPADAIRALETP